MKRAHVWLVLVAGLGACNAILGNEERTLYTGGAATGGVDAGGGTGASGGSGGSGGDASLDVASDVEVIVDCDAGVTDDASIPICPGNVMYVSDTGGSDSNSGCSPCFPKATIDAAIATLRDASSPDGGGASIPSGFALHVCAGEYAETSLLLDIPVSLFGSFDCASWTRVGGYGWPGFDPTNASIIRNGDASKQTDSLRLKGTEVNSSVTVDGFTIRGWESTAPFVNSVALGIRGGATPIIRNNLVQGGSSSGSGGGGGASNIASTGVWVEDSSPEIFENEIEGGSGISADYGSAGVAVFGAASLPKLHDNLIRGGAGASQDGGSTGIHVGQGVSLTVAGGNPITKNVIWGGTGVDASLYGVSAAGVVLWSASDLVDNEIHGELSLGSNGIVVGVQVNAAALVARNRIYPGSGAPSSTSVGIWVTGNGARIENNMVHSGGGGTQVVGVWIQGDAATLLHNTIYSAALLGSTSTQSSQILVEASQGNVIRGNILMADTAAEASAIIADECFNTPMVAALHDNVLLNDDNLAYLLSSGCPGANNALSQIENQIKSAGGTASGNVYYKGVGQCGGQTGCLELAECSGSGPAQPCFTLLFTGWTSINDGIAQLFGDGWKLKPNSAPCSIAKGVSTKSVDFDLYGATRTGEMSRGAHEMDDPCN